ncbi:MAG: preprotein translocase subunit SecE [Opitutales bacterium]
MKNPFRSIRLFWGEMIAELRKASWPSRTELRDSTIVVIIAVAILGGFISVSDFALLNVVELFTDLVVGS